jgi:acetolactate synthase-1/2/3 large subunit
MMGLSSFPREHKLSLGMPGMHGTAYANHAIHDCDLLLAFGVRFDDRVTGKVSEFAKHATIVHVDIDPSEINKIKQANIAIAGNVKDVMQGLLKKLKAHKPAPELEQWHKKIDQWKKDMPMDYGMDSPRITAQYAIHELWKATKDREAIIVTGVGQHQMWAAQYLDFKEPRRLLTSGSMGTMGFGLPAAIGAQAAFPDKTVLDIDGDGSLRMNIGELETATTYNLPIKLLLLNNRADGMVRQWQRLFYDCRFSGSDKTLRRKNFVRTAEADGFGFAERVEDKNLFVETLRKFIAFDGPAFLEVVTDPDAVVYPMVGPGLGYKDMVTGDFIQERKEDDYAPDRFPQDAF